jgi:hypothetical protein
MDVYIPVETHRAKCKGGKDILVASAPMGED